MRISRGFEWTIRLTIAGPMYQGKPVTSGYVAIQSESQPLEFKDILLKVLQ